MNEVICSLRHEGALIIHAPADCAEYYRGAPARERAIAAPHADAPVPFAWNPWDPRREPPLPQTLADSGSCSCEATEPCCDATQSQPWTRQTPLIGIESVDAVSEDGQEIYNLLESRAIDDVVVMGVHANICILSRWYGIRQLVYLGKRPVLCRDLTDSYHRDPRGHAFGTESIIAHIERHWCPTVSSDELIGGTH